MASSYTTSFGIEKIGSGDQSGAWGTTTNHNFDILDRIASFKAVGLSGSTHTLTVREASPDSGTENLQDGMFRVIQFTGALGANNTVTVAPNTTSAYFIMINSTTDSGSSGPYSVIVSQGSGANITIANGKSAIVYMDGAGSGAAVVDAISNLQLATLTASGDITSAGTVNVTGDTAAGDDASIGHTASEGLILTGQGSTNDVTIKNDADADVITIATGGTNVDIVGDVTASTVNADGDTSAGDNAAMGYTAAEGLILTGQGSTNDVTIKNDADEAGTATNDMTTKMSTQQNLNSGEPVAPFVGDVSTNALEIGHASDTTLARSSSGNLSIEGNLIYRAGGTDVPVADGGTGASSLTDGGILLGSGTSAITAMSALAKGSIVAGDGATDPVELAVGANDTVLTADSSEASGLKWAAASGGSGYELLSATTCSGTSLVSLETMESGYHYRLIASNLVPASNNQDLHVQVGTSGPSYATSGYQYIVGGFLGTNLTKETSTSASQFRVIGQGGGTATGEQLFCDLHILNPATSERTILYGNVGGKDHSGTMIEQNFVGFRSTAEANTAVKIFFASANIATGNVYFYRLKAA